ncbi:DUF3331 domain-containing protein [Paraburkholderia piptadeniae]|uniref:DUF3331 domain-containing protein n=1 Tax=Paraburkholderia piptadeniae TaxID=1701573 RepID=UPI0034DDB461
MGTLAEEDIGRRALLDILIPNAHTPDSATGTARGKKQRFRLKKRRMREERAPEVDAEPRPTCISVVERLSSETVSVCWSDARMGRYSEQVWRLGRAHRFALPVDGQTDSIWRQDLSAPDRAGLSHARSQPDDPRVRHR